MINKNMIIKEDKMANTNESKTDRFFKYLITAAVGITIGAALESRLDPRMIPQLGVDETERGYAVPSRLKIKVEDLDGNGEKEVIMVYDNENYLLTLDEYGMPRVQRYDLRRSKPVEVVPK